MAKTRIRFRRGRPTRIDKVLLGWQTGDGKYWQVSLPFFIQIDREQRKRAARGEL